MDIISVIVTISIVLITFYGIAALIYTLKNRSSQNAKRLSLEEKTFDQLKSFSTHLESNPHLRRRLLLRYYKRLRITMTVFMWEKYGVTIRDRISDDVLNSLLEKNPRDSVELNVLADIFEELEAFKQGRNGNSKLRELYATAMNMLTNKVS